MQDTTRRKFLASLAAGSGAVLAAGRGTASEGLSEYEEAWPEHVSVTFDRETLESFQPALVIPSSTDVRPSTMYAWTTSSPEFEYDVHSYVVFYHTQYGVTDKDSHLPDREMAQIYTDPSLSEVREAVYSAGHWTAYRDTSPNVYEENGKQHVTLQIDPSYHHHIGTEEVGTLGVDIEPLGEESKLFDDSTARTQYERWLVNGWAGKLRPGALINGDIMRFRENYWAENRDTFRDRLYASMAQRLAQLAPAVAVPDEFENSEYR